MRTVLRDAQEALRGVWTILGVFARVEGTVDRIVERYTDGIPEALGKIVLKRLSADDRRRCLVVVLDEAGLTEVYPDLPDLFTELSRFRNLVANADVSLHLGDDGIDQLMANPDPYALPFKVGIMKGLSDEPELVLEREDVIEMHDKAARLIGLLETLRVDLGHVRLRDLTKDVKDPSAWVTGVDALGPIDQSKPREPRDPVRPGVVNPPGD